MHINRGAQEAPTTDKMEYTDQLNRTISLNQAPTRIISCVPSTSELLYDLGLEEEVVGITKFCVHPETWHKYKTRVGGTKNLHLDQIEAMSSFIIRVILGSASSATLCTSS